MSVNQDYDHLLDQLVDNPHAFYFFYSLFVKRTDLDLPFFIDRGKEIHILDRMGLAEYFDPEKHLHTDPIVLTALGKRVGRFFADAGHFERFTTISTTNLIEYEQSFSQAFQEYLTEPEWFTTWDADPALGYFNLPSIGEKKQQSDVELTILGWKRTQIEYNYKFCLRIRCRRCSTIFEVIQSIQYNPDEYSLRPLHIKQLCKNCQLTFFCDAYFSRFYMDTDDDPENY